MTMYEVNTTDRGFITANARAAAEMACNWKRRGFDPGAYVIRNSGRLTVLEAEITTVSETATRLVALSREPAK